MRAITDKVLSTLAAEPMGPGTLITVERLEDLFGCKFGTQPFSWLVSELRGRLYDFGVYLSGEGVGQTAAYEILHPRDHHWVAQLSMAKCERDLEGKQRLLVRTDLTNLSSLEVHRHEGTLREISFKLRAFRNQTEREEIKEKPKLISKPGRAKLSTAEHSPAEPSAAKRSMA